jgi:hypothetical protein
MKSSKRRLQALTEGSDGMHNYLKMEDSETSIPPVFRSRLHELFSQIEKEFDLLYTENLNRKSHFLPLLQYIVRITLNLANYNFDKG